MRHRHFETLQPVCPSCRDIEGGQQHVVQIASVDRGDDQNVFEGILHCSNPSCLHEYPIIDGIPYLLPSLRSFISNNILSIHSRNDLSPNNESILGDCCGPGSPFDAVRQLLSSYAWDHYGDLDPELACDNSGPGGMLRILQRLLSMTTKLSDGPILDVGCSVGRGAFALAEQSDNLVLGVDVNVPMLRMAAEVLQTGKVCYPLRRVGVVYDRRESHVHFENRENVDFWACDATALPFSAGTFHTAVGLNVLDSTQDPRELLGALARSLQPGGQALLACPYDWSAGATPVETWIGGHSQRGPEMGSSCLTLRNLLTPGHKTNANVGLEISAEFDGMDWQVRIHERSHVHYKTHLVVATALHP